MSLRRTLSFTKINNVLILSYLLGLVYKAAFMSCLIYLNKFGIKCGKKGVSVYMKFDVKLIYVEFNKFKKRETFVVIFTHFEKKNQDGGSQRQICRV